MDLVHQIVVQEGVTDLVHCWYRRVSVTGSPECCPPPRRATLHSLKTRKHKMNKKEDSMNIEILTFRGDFKEGADPAV